MRFAYAARFENTGPGEVVVSFRDLPECLTSGADEVEALEEAQDALEAVIAARINRGDTIPIPSDPIRGEHLVAVPTDISAKAAFVLAFRESGLTQEGLAQRLGTKQPVSYTECSIRVTAPRQATSIERSAFSAASSWSRCAIWRCPDL